MGVTAVLLNLRAIYLCLCELSDSAYVDEGSTSVRDGIFMFCKRLMK